MFIESVQLWPAVAGDVTCLADRFMLQSWRWIVGDARIHHLEDHEIIASAGVTLTVPVLEYVTHAYAPFSEDRAESEQL